MAAAGKGYNEKLPDMKRRLLNGWSIRRGIYLLIGLTILVQGVLMQEWIGIIGGAYFLVMGILGLGCADGNCSQANCDTPISTKDFQKIKNHA